MEQQQFEMKVNRIAQLLGKTPFDVEFRHSQNSLWARLRKGDEDIGIANGGRQEEDTFHISGFYPRAINGKEPYNLKTVSISMTEKKSPGQMAREICRRFMPTYQERLAEAVELVAATNGFIKERTEGIKAIAEVAGVPVNFVNGKEYNEGTVTIYDVDRGFFEVHSYCRGCFRMDLRGVPLEQAKQIIQILKSE